MDELTRTCQCEYYSLQARPNSCFFCKHCTDIFIDAETGRFAPYMWLCELTENGGCNSDRTDKGMMGRCKDFTERQQALSACLYVGAWGYDD